MQVERYGRHPHFLGHMRLVPGGFWVEGSGLFRVCPYTLGVDEPRLFRSLPDPVAVLRALEGDLELQERNLAGLHRRVKDQLREIRERISSAIEELQVEDTRESC